MNLTNQHGAPDAFVRALQDDSYTKGEADFSVTGLLQPPQIVRLKAEHEDKLSSDVRDRIWMLLGTSVHNTLEKYGEGLVEQRLFAECDGTTISGAIDLDVDGDITDYKVTSVFTVQKALKPDWEAQLNMYAWLLEQNGKDPKSLTIVAICRDWMKSRAGKNNYPESMIVSIPVPLWPSERRDRFVRRRVEAHTAEATMLCTNEERWARGAYSVVGGKGRPKKFDTLAEATAFINAQKSGNFSVVDGDARYIRCESWCDVSEFCSQWQAEEKSNG
jgi:hypothetical protein|tara:strand:- start:12758 stop:13582 length:825 start_codon:yes stop_codon:yes gene_type:complete